MAYANHNCSSDYNVALIIPYRDRNDSLKLFLNNMHAYLTRQKINYKLYLVEPNSNATFNRGILMNIGYVEAIRDEARLGFEWNCFLFHDVDLIPEDLRIIYMCDQNLPMHFSVSVSSLNYK